MAMNPVPRQPDEPSVQDIIKAGLGWMGPEMTYEDNVYADEIDGAESWTSGVEIISALGGGIQASWERLPDGSLLLDGTSGLGIEVAYREWDPLQNQLTTEIMLAQVSSPSHAAAVMRAVADEHNIEATRIASSGAPARHRPHLIDEVYTVLEQVKPEPLRMVQVRDQVQARGAWPHASSSSILFCLRNLIAAGRIRIGANENGINTYRID